MANWLCVHFAAAIARPRSTRDKGPVAEENCRGLLSWLPKARDTTYKATAEHSQNHAIMRIIVLACAATTHALVAPPRRQPAQTLRKVKIDTDNFFFKALDGAKELAF